MYDSIAPVCFDVLAVFFFNALLIITHWLLLTPPSASDAPFSPPEQHPSLFPCLSCVIPPQPLSLRIGPFVFGKEIRRNDMGLEMKRVTKTYQRAESTESRNTIGYWGNQTCLHFSQPSSLSVISSPEEGSIGGWVRIRIWVSVCECKCAWKCVFACVLCAVNIEIQRDEHVDTDSTHLLQSWPKYKAACAFLVLS